MNKQAYRKMKKDYLKNKKWLLDNLDGYLKDKKDLESIESGKYPKYMLSAPVKEIEEYVNKLKGTILLYEIVVEGVRAYENFGLQFVSRRTE